MSHVYILTTTNHRVPRWFTEGLAVHEEGQAAPEWANRLTPEVLAAIREKKLLPVAKMDRGFVFPEYPEQVIVSYFQAGSICDYIGSKWGEDKLLGMVHSYGGVEDDAGGDCRRTWDCRRRSSTSSIWSGWISGWERRRRTSTSGARS